MFLIHLLPCLLLIIFNGLLLAGVFQAEKKRSNLVVSRARRRGRSGRKHRHLNTPSPSTLLTLNTPNSSNVPNFTHLTLGLIAFFKKSLT